MPKGPKDLNQTAFDIVAQITGGPTSAEVERASKGGVARADSLSDERKAEIARNAAAARWNKPPQPGHA